MANTNQGPGPGLARRRFPRRRFKRRVSVLHKGVYHLGTGVEIGEGGMLLEVGTSIAEGDMVLVNFMLPATGISIVQAQVRSTRVGEQASQYGLLFTNLDYEGKKGIREYISSKSVEESIEEMRRFSD